MAELEIKHRHANLMITIVDRDEGKKVAKLLNSVNIGGSFILLGKGTANSEMLDYFGIGETAKDVIFTPLAQEKIEAAFNILRDKMQLDKPGHGIAFTIPMASIAGSKTLREIISERIKEVNNNGK